MDVKLSSWTPDYFIANKSICEQILKDPNVLKDIPSLNCVTLDNVVDKQLIRFRGMVQDIYNPEIYFKECMVQNTVTGIVHSQSGLYQDFPKCLANEEINFDSLDNVNSERQTCVVISIPGLNDWAKEKVIEFKNSNDTTDSLFHNSNKRTLETDECEKMDCSEPSRKKERSTSIERNGPGTLDTNCQKMVVSKEHLLNFPVPIHNGKACLVKIYDEQISVKLNQIIEIVGFISLDPTLSIIQNSDQMEDTAELNTHNPPASIIPRLHAIKVIYVAKSEIPNPLEVISKAERIRGDLHILLTQLLFGDQLAADYLICNLLSTVYMRKNNLCLGSIPMNITNFPIKKYPTFPNDLYEFIQLFVKKSYLLPISLETLNEMSLLPKKDYDCNRLTSGVLQLSDNTHLIIDETKLTSGQVSENGRKNYDAIDDLIKYQKARYDFKFYSIDYDTNIPVLILSEAKSFIPCPTQIILKVDMDSENMYTQILEASKQFLNSENRLSQIRQYIEVLRDIKFTYEEDIAATIQRDFVNLRQSNHKTVAEDLHRLMVLARLTAVSYGSNKLTAEFWRKALTMETERKKRLPHHML